MKARADLSALAKPLRSYTVGVLPIPKAGDQAPRLPTATSIFNHCIEAMRGADREIFRVLCLDARTRLLADVVVSVGSVDSCHVDPREVFAPAVMVKASAVVLVHNHPSGDPEPSMQDILLTQQLKQAGELLCIRVIDHVVLSSAEGGGFVSLSQRGQLRGTP